MQNHICKSSNSTLASLVCEIKSNLDKTVHFIVKETHRLHNAVTELDIAKLTSCFFQCFISRPLVITMLRYLALLTSPMDLLIHTKHNLLMSNNLDQIWFWKNIPITFSQGCTLTDFPISIRLTSLALWQSNDCPSASKATLMNMDKYFMWIHYERLHNHNKAKHNKTVCTFLRIYCI